MNAASLTEAIFYELRPGDVNTTYATEFNQLVFDILMNAFDEVRHSTSYSATSDPRTTVRSK
jgi:hypothetical protein